MNTTGLNSSKSKIPDYLFVVTALLFYILLCARSFAYVSFDQPIAETVSDLLLGALQDPYNIFQPIVDGIFLLPRLFAGIAISINKVNAAIVLSLMSIAFHSFVAAYFTREEFRDIMPNKYLRFLVGCFIAFGPGSLRIVGSANFIIYPAVLLLCLLGLGRSKSWAFYYPASVLFLGLSSNFSIVVMPLYLARAVIFKNMQSLLCLLILVFCTVINIIPVLSADSPFSTLTRMNIKGGESKVLLIELFEKFVTRTDSSTVFYCAFFSIITILLLFLLRRGKIAKSEYWLLGVGLFVVSIAYILIHLMARPYGIGSLAERHSALIFVPALLGIAISFKNIELGNDGYSIVTKCIVFLIIPGILYQIINSDERFKTGESTPWSQIVGEIGFIPEGTVRRYAIGPVFDNSYWGEVKCQKLNADTKCIVTNKNGVQLDYIFK